MLDTEMLTRRNPDKNTVGVEEDERKEASEKYAKDKQGRKDYKLSISVFCKISNVKRSRERGAHSGPMMREGQFFDK